MKTTKEVIADYPQFKKLINAVVKQLGGTEYMEDIVNHGIGGGFSGFIYYNETFAFYKKNKAQILELVSHLAAELGESDMQCVKNFNCLNNDKETEIEIGQALYGNPKESTCATNALAWFAAEEVSRMFTEN